MKIKNHLVTYGEWREWSEYQEYIFEDENVINHYDANLDTPSKQECDRLSAALSGPIKVSNINLTR